MLSGVCFSGKHGIKANDRLGQKGQFNPKDSSTSPATAYLGTKGSCSPNTPMVAEHLWFDWMASGLVAHPTCLRQQLLHLQLLPVFLWDHRDLKTHYRSFSSRNTSLGRKLQQKVDY